MAVPKCFSSMIVLLRSGSCTDDDEQFSRLPLELVTAGTDVTTLLHVKAGQEQCDRTICYGHVSLQNRLSDTDVLSLGKSLVSFMLEWLERAF